MESPHIQPHEAELHALCRTCGVERLALFGSATSEAFDAAASDLDVTVRFADTSPGYADRYLDFAEALEELFGRDVDLVTERSISNPYFRQSVDATREVVYDGRREERHAKLQARAT
jgi:predicted nucleotidyltransferase